MTAVLSKAPASVTDTWATMPGWGIVVDLTPRSIGEARRLRRLKRLLAAVLVLLFAACAGGFVLAWRNHSAASAVSAQALEQTTTLQAQAGKYGGITQIEAAVATVDGQLASAMATDVDTARLLGKIRSSLPKSMTITNLSLNMTALPGAPAVVTAGSTGLDTSGHAQIGTVSITGLARNLNDLPSYVDALSSLPGVVNVVPSSNQRSSMVVSFTLQLALTDELFSHHYETTTAPGGK